MTDQERAAAVRRVADDIEAWYPPDVFTPLTPERLAKVREVLAREGMTTDAFAAHVMRHACKVMRHHADQLERGDES